MSWSSTRALIRVSEEQENKEPIESTDGVPTKDPPKVKLVIGKPLRT